MEGGTLIIRGDISPLTGDVSHDGCVVVQGAVRPGYTVRADGDLTVRGNVTRAWLFAGGDLTVEGVAEGEGTQLDAVGSVKVRQARDARIVAGLDIEVLSAAERCEMTASRRILATRPPGLIRGGSCRAGLGVEVRRLAASGDRRTRVEIGRAPFERAMEDVSRRLEYARKRLEMTLIAAPDGGEAYRRRVADANSYRQLATSLAWRLKQVENACSQSDPSYLKVTGTAPVQAKITLGPAEETLSAHRLPPSEAFMAVAAGELITIQSVEERHRVG